MSDVLFTGYNSDGKAVYILVINVKIVWSRAAVKLH